MTGWRPYRVVAMALCVALGGAACASRGPAGPGSPAPPASASASASSPPTPATGGMVVVRLGAAAYAQGAVVHLTVANGLDRPIYTEDFKTGCTIVLLQRQDGTAWRDITGCAMGRPTMTVTIGPGELRAVALDPASFHLRPAGFGPGTYRIRFTFRLDKEARGDDPFVVTSPAFTIR